MSIFLNAFFGKIAGTIFIVVCTALGFGPEEWAKFLITNGPIWLTPKIAQIVFVILAIVTLITLLWKKLHSLISKIKLWLNQLFSEIEWIDDPHSIHSFSYVISRPHNLALVEGIRLKGKNTSKTSITVKKAYLQSLVTGECLDVNIENIKAENIEITSGTNFVLIVKFPNEDGKLTQNSIQGISFQSFLKRFSNFEIVIETDNKSYKIEFEDKETQQWVSSIHMGLMMPAPGQKAGVLKR